MVYFPWILSCRKYIIFTFSQKALHIQNKRLPLHPQYGSSSVGRALVSKTRCREFEPLLPCIKQYIFLMCCFFYASAYMKIIPWSYHRTIRNSFHRIIRISSFIRKTVLLSEEVFHLYETVVSPKWNSCFMLMKQVLIKDVKKQK